MDLFRLQNPSPFPRPLNPSPIFSTSLALSPSSPRENTRTPRLASPPAATVSAASCPQPRNPRRESSMDQAGSMEERVITERIRRKLEEVNAAAQKHLAGVQDHVNFTMQVRAPLNLSSVSTFFFSPRGSIFIVFWGYTGPEIRKFGGIDWLQILTDLVRRFLD